MRIAMVHESPYDPDRWPRFRLISQHLLRQGHDVSILAFWSGQGTEDDPPVREIAGGTLAYVLSAAVYIISSQIVFSSGLIFPLVRILNQERPDAVIFHYAHVGFILALAKRVLGWSAVLVYDWNDLGVRMRLFPARPRFRDAIWLWLEEQTVPRLADRVVVVTGFARNWLCSRGMSRQKIVVVNELVPLKLNQASMKSKIGRSPDQRTVIWHGYVRRYQVPGLVTVIDALGHIPASSRPKFTIVGPFDDSRSRRGLEELAAKMGVEIELLGLLSRANLDTLLDEADVGIQLLPDELFSRFINGVKLAEYVAHGLPVICSRLGGPGELIDRNGILVDPENPAEIAKAIMTILSDSYEGFVENSVRRAVEEFSEDAIRTKVSQIAEAADVARS